MRDRLVVKKREEAEAANLRRLQSAYLPPVSDDDDDDDDGGGDDDGDADGDGDGSRAAGGALGVGNGKGTSAEADPDLQRAIAASLEPPSSRKARAEPLAEDEELQAVLAASLYEGFGGGGSSGGGGSGGGGSGGGGSGGGGSGGGGSLLR